VIEAYIDFGNAHKRKKCCILKSNDVPSSGTPMKICVSYPVDVCYVIICTKKNRANQNIEMLLMPVLLPAILPTFFTRPESGFGLSLIPLASLVFLLVNRFDDFR
jgi:hypothetical protein